MEKKQNKEKRRRLIRAFVLTASAALLICVSALPIAGAIMKHSVKNRIKTTDELKTLGKFDCVIVLGCRVYDNERPADMLRDRLEAALSLYESGVVDTFLMSGDHGQTDYDEVNVMKDYAKSRGVPSERVFMDHAGFSTYETMYRAKEVFKVERAVIVTQSYHLTRAVYIAGKLGIDAYGFSADLRTYAGQTSRDIREALARVKDAVKCIFKPEPKYLGEAIPISGNGDLTNDREV